MEKKKKGGGGGDAVSCPQVTVMSTSEFVRINGMLSNYFNCKYANMWLICIVFI